MINPETDREDFEKGGEMRQYRLIRTVLTLPFPLTTLFVAYLGGALIWDAFHAQIYWLVALGLLIEVAVLAIGSMLTVSMYQGVSDP